MKITNTSGVNALQHLRPASQAFWVGKTGAGGTDRLSLSKDVQQMRFAEAERVATLKEAIASGKYKVDLERLARTMIEKELL